MLIDQWILEITDILMNKIVSYWKKVWLKKILRGFAAQNFFCPPPIPKSFLRPWNFPFLCGNIPQSPSYGVYISQLIRYARASTLYDDFLSRSCRLTSKLLRQGYERFKLISAFKKFYGRHKILVDRYKVSVTHIISDLFLETLYRSWLTCYYGSLLCMFDCILIYVHFYNG